MSIETINVNLDDQSTLCNYRKASAGKRRVVQITYEIDDADWSSGEDVRDKCVEKLSREKNLSGWLAWLTD